MRGELANFEFWIVNWAQAKVAEYLEASMWLAPAGEKKTTYYDKEGNKGIFNNQEKWENNSCDKKWVYWNYLFSLMDLREFT